MRKWFRNSRLLQILVGVVIAMSAVLMGAAVAGASAPSDASHVIGTLKVRLDGENQTLAGVRITVSDDGGAEIGTATSADDGTWSVEVPGPGTYTVVLDEASLPDGVAIREGHTNTNTAELKAAGDKSVIFQLVDANSAGGASSSGGGTVKWVQLIVDGFKFGLIIAICAVGLSLIYGTTGLVNFAHGEMVTLGAITAYVINVATGWGGIFGSLIFGSIVAVLVTGAAGGLFNEFVWKPMRSSGASLIAALVVSIGFSILFRYIYLIFFGGRAKFYRDYQIQTNHNFFGLFGLATKDLFVMGLSLLILVLVALGLERTKAGKAMRAVADNRDLAESSGIDVEAVVRWVWIGGAALAGIGGVFFGLSENINWEMGFRLLLLMFAGITLGGLGTAYGALFGSLVIGIFIQLSTLVVPPDLKNVGALLLLVLILLVRPQGLLGKSERIG